MEGVDFTGRYDRNFALYRPVDTTIRRCSLYVVHESYQERLSHIPQHPVPRA